MRLAARRKQVGGDVADSGNISDHIDLFGHVGELREKLGVRVALENLSSQRVIVFERLGKTLGVCFVKKHLRLEDVCGSPRNSFVITQSQVQKHANGRSALHVRQLLEGEFGGDFRDRDVAQNHVLQELGFDTSRAGRPGQRVIDEELERIFPMRVLRVFDLVDQRFDQFRGINRLRVKALFFTRFDFFQVGVVQIHGLDLWVGKLGATWLKRSPRVGWGSGLRVDSTGSPRPKPMFTNSPIIIQYFQDHGYPSSARSRGSGFANPEKYGLK